MARKPAIPGIDRRQQILEAALEIFAEQGFDAATNKAIAESAGVNQGLIYFYFASKADVYFTTFAYHTEQVIAQLDMAFEQKEDIGAADDLKRLLREIMQILSSQTATRLLRLLMHRMTGDFAPQGELSSQESLKAMSGFVRHLSRRLREYLEGQISRGAFTMANAAQVSELMTRTLIVTFGGRGQETRHQLDLNALAETMAWLYCYGLLPREV
jgi:AcrR family transcriptional regulator